MQAGLTDAQLETIRQICHTLYPSLPSSPGEDRTFLASCADDFEIHLHLRRRIESAGGEEVRRVQRLLQWLEKPFFNGWLAGHWRRFSQLSISQRTDVLRAWSGSRLAALRQAFQTFKRLTLFLAYATPLADGLNPSWKTLGYNGRRPLDTVKDQPPLPLFQTDRSQISCDVLVVGTGAGGAVAGSELAAAGHDVLLVDKGEYFENGQLGTGELDGNRKLFEKHGALATKDLSLVILAGSTVGGGTTVNWMTSLEPPEEVRQQWSRSFGFHGAVEPAYQTSLNMVAKRIGVNTEESAINPQNEALQRGCQSLGIRTQVIARNVRGCDRCDFCGYGCVSGAKQDTRQTFLADACQSGARLMAQTSVEQIEVRHGAVCGAQLTVVDPSGQSQSVSVRCKAMVVACGAIQTPLLLLKSGLGNRQTGRNLYLHPTTAVAGFYEEPMFPWRGPPQTIVSDHFANLDNQGYGVRFEVAPTHPGFAAMALAWHSGEHHKHLMRRLAHMGNVIIITRDRFPGSVRLAPNGRPLINYRLNRYDARHMQRGITEALRIQKAAGAQQLLGPHNQFISYPDSTHRSFDQFLDQVQRAGVRPNAIGLYSAHQLGTCRIAHRSSLGVVDPCGQAYTARNLFVVDGSVLPTSCGVNPMLSIMGTAHYLAQQIKSQLQVPAG